MQCYCPHCCQLVVQDRNVDGLQYCTSCKKIFCVPPKRTVPAWIWGVLAILVVNWLNMCHF
jgi:hypothetical protein